MADLSERLGLERAKNVSFRAAGSFQHTAACIEADRRAVVEAVVRWLKSSSEADEHIGEVGGIAAEAIRDLLLAPPSPGEGREPDEEREGGDCSLCIKYAAEGFGPSHNGSRLCESGSIASGGKRSHCTCDVCF